MDLRDYLRVLRRSWPIVLAVTLLGLLGGAAGNLMVTPTYTSETQLFVAIQNSGSVQELQQGNTFSQARVQSYVKTATTPAVLQPAIDSLGLSATAEQLASRVTAKSDINTVLISIAVADSSPVQASATAQAVASSLVRVVESLEQPKTGGTSPIRLSIVTPATVPTMPSAPNTKLNLALGLFVGLAAGVGTAVLRNLMDNRVHGEADVAAISAAPVLGRIAFEPLASTSPLLTQSPSQSPRAESFRQLRTNLQFATAAGQGKSIVITSSLPGEGKSTTAANIAIALSEAGQAVCLVDADLRRPMMNEYLGLDRNVGLTTALIGRAEVDDVLQPWGETNLFVLTSGQLPPNPSELLGSARMSNLVMRLEEIFDVVVIDAPPLLPVTDAAVISRNTDGVVLVVGVDKIKRQDLEKSIDSLRLVDANFMGIVINRLPMKGPDAYAYAYYSTDETVARWGKSAEDRTSPNHGDLSGSHHVSRLDESREATVFPATPRD
ncbi:polysaccharide biosynthesis tyrosine autokinase [Arthrobacter nitrophenolicus]|uniref:non-specific protein-tyrosine kinase n=1 Tax=Arthrobacter nitrophenolicus TaxID=683150 RepID=A0A4R5YCY8_9MICC|nr:polysaccharide biosynthesis tyrosine autokinase [Arthrobacter nitrophenolicus]TDL41115.1 polysaccharide biosynthesis tyrosine autokinase [Arthrobacter nitrophenolicus]